ncbi:hypothetical protein [Oceaniglobus indicus]|uniref:hypothetical protein n=1 Tax=Oceaniglobus indicus TaxID=2047749 RepID=UPI000C196DCE|nr:hypothetical protein [Oceaniglobus indicus]
MLAGLLFLGVIAASAMPDLMEILRGSADDTDDDPDNGADGDEESMLDHATPPDDDPEQQPDDGIDLFADPRPGVTLVEAFNPGVDTLTVTIPDSAQDFSLTTDDETNTSSLGFVTDDGAVEIRFDGLDAVPVDDIYLRVSDASSPTQDADIALSSVMEGIETPEDLAPIVLQPEDPEAGEEPAPPADTDAPALSPEDPEQDEGPAPPAPFPGPVLNPVMDDVAPEPDALRNGRQPANDPGDTAGLPDGETDAPSDSDIHWLYPSDTGPDFAAVADFRPGEDILHISLDPSQSSEQGTLDISTSDDGRDGVVRIDGATVAILLGMPDIGPGDIIVDHRTDIFA